MLRANVPPRQMQPGHQDEDSTDLGHSSSSAWSVSAQALRTTHHKYELVGADDEKMPPGSPAFKEVVDGEAMDRTSSWMVDHGSLPPVLHRSDGKASDSQCIFNMVNAQLVTGLLGFPYCFKTCGLLLTFILMLLAYHVNFFSTSSLLLMAQLSGKGSYEELASYSFGFPGRFAVMACLFTLNLGCLVAYVNILADVLSSVAGSIIPPGAESSRDLLLISVCVLAVLPVSMAVRTSDLMASISTASLAFLGFFTLVVFVLAFAPISNAKPVTYWDGAGVSLSLPVVLNAFTSHTVLFSVYSTMRSPSVKRMKRVVSRSLLCCGLFYLIVGVAGYLAFRQRTSGDVLRNLGGSAVAGLRALYERALRLGYGLAALGCVPLVMLPLQHTILPLLVPLASMIPRYGAWIVAPATEPAPPPSSLTRSGSINSSKGHNNQIMDGMDISSPLAHGLTVFLSFLSLLCAIFLPNVELILGLMGSTGAVGAAMILPGAITLRIMSVHGALPGRFKDSPADEQIQWQDIRRKALAMLVGGLLLATWSTHRILEAVKEEAEVVQLAQQLHAKETLLLQAAEVEQKARGVALAVGSVEQVAESLGSIGRGQSEQDQEKSIDKISKSLDETDLILQREAEQAGKEMAKEVDKELEAVEGIVEEVTHLKDTDTVDNSEIVLGMLSESQVKEINGHEKAEQQAAKVEGAEGQPVDSAVATATQWHQPNHKVTVGELQHKASYAADEISGALQSRLDKGTVSEASEGSDFQGSLVVDKVASKLDKAIEALAAASQQGRNGTVDGALNTTYDATTALNTTMEVLKEVTVKEAKAIVERVQSLVQQLAMLEESSSEEGVIDGGDAAKSGDVEKQAELVERDEVKESPTEEGEHDAADKEEKQAKDKVVPEGDLPAKDTKDLEDEEKEGKEAKQQLKEAMKVVNESTNATTFNLTDVASKAVQAAEAATSAALWDIKSAVRNVDPRVASRAEQIAQEMTILAAIDSMAEQSRREAEKASLGMSVKTVADASPTEGNFTADMERQVPLSPGESEGDKAEEAEDGKGGRSAIPDGSLGRKGGAQEISNSQSDHLDDDISSNHKSQTPATAQHKQDRDQRQEKGSEDSPEDKGKLEGVRPSTRRRQGRRKDQTQDAQAVDQQAQGGRGVGLPEGGGVSDAGVSERRDGTKAVVSGVVLEEGREEGWEELKQEEAVKHSQWRGEHQRNAKAELILDEETVQRRQAGG